MGLPLQVAYTYSHEIDEVTNDLNSLSNPFNPAYDHGSGGFDRRHILNMNYIYNLPFFEHSSNLRGAHGPGRLAVLRRNGMAIGNAAIHPLHGLHDRSVWAAVLRTVRTWWRRSPTQRSGSHGSTPPPLQIQSLPGLAVQIKALAMPEKTRSWDRDSSTSIGPCSKPFTYSQRASEPGTAVRVLQRLQPHAIQQHRSELRGRELRTSHHRLRSSHPAARGEIPLLIRYTMKGARAFGPWRLSSNLAIFIRPQ